MQLELADPPDVKETLVGEHDTDRLGEGLTDSVRDTFPEKPPRLVRVTVEDPLLPVWKLTVAGFATIEKSTMLTVIWREWVSPPLEPVMVTE